MIAGPVQDRDRDVRVGGNVTEDRSELAVIGLVAGIGPLWPIDPYVRRTSSRTSTSRNEYLLGSMVIAAMLLSGRAPSNRVLW